MIVRVCWVGVAWTGVGVAELDGAEEAADGGACGGRDADAVAENRRGIYHGG